MFIGVRARGRGGLQPPQLQKFFGQNTYDSVLGRKHSKKVVKARLEGYFLRRWPYQKTELRSNYLRIQVFVSEKPYIVCMCVVEIHEMDITSINKTMTELKRRPRLLLWCLWKEPLSMAPQRAVLKFCWTSRTRGNLMFLLQVFDFTRQSIEVIEDTRFQNNCSWIPISRSFIFFNLPITQNKSRFPLPSWTLQF